jgi:hypothetical protein
MNNNEKASKPSKSLKQSHRVEAQLAHRKKAQSDAVSETVTTPASAIELVPASFLPPVENVHVAEAETAEAVEILPESQLQKVE